MNILIIVLVSIGTFILFTAAVGVIRLPDFYTRSNALGMIDTVGMSFILIGIAIYSGFSLDAIKILLIIIFIQIANPAITHILARAAMRSGLKPITGKEKPKK